MKIKVAQPRRIKRTESISFRLSPEAIKQLNSLAKVTNKTKTQVIEEMIEDAFKDTIGGK